MGGVGDFLQIADAAIREKKIKVYSHSSSACSFFAGLGVEAHINLFDDALPPNAPEPFLERNLFPSFVPPASSIDNAEKLLKGEDYIVGIHPVGGEFWHKYVAKLGVSIKKILPPPETRLLLELFPKGTRFLVYGGANQLTPYKQELQDFSTVTYIDYENIWDSLATVLFCHLIIGVDSSIKTMASCKRIPSIVFVGDTPDPFRDAWFIDPYVQQGVMQTIKYETITPREITTLKEIIN